MISGTRYQLRLETNRQLKLAADIARGQSEISTRKRVIAPSDDPAAAARISDIARSQADGVTWSTNIDRAAALAAQADDVLGVLKGAFDRAGELMLAASNGTLSAENRRTVGIELASIAEEVAALRDTRDSRGELLFPDGDPLAIPVGPDLQVRAVASRGEIFDNVTAAAGPTSLSAIIGAASAALASDDDAAIQAAMADVTAATDHLIAAHSEQGARGARIDTYGARLADAELGLAEERSGLEDANIVDVVARIQASQLSLEAAQAVFARINRQTLFDLIG